MPTFQSIWSHYPASDPCDAKDAKGQRLFKNQCAIRMSHALKGSGVSLASFPAARKCWVHPKDHHVLAARELANWLQRQPFTGLGSWMRARFGIVGPGFWSDFRKARHIRFFPLP